MHHPAASQALLEVAANLVNVVEECEELVELALRDRVELVIVAARAAEREPKKGRAGRADAVDHCFDAILLEIGAPFLIDHRVAMEAGGDELVLRRLWQQISGNLLDHELVEGEIVVECVDDPVTVGPDRARSIDRVAVGVRIAGDVEPVPAPAFSVVRRFEQSLYKSPVGTRLGVRHEAPGFFRCRQQAGKVQACPANQGAPICDGRRL